MEVYISGQSLSNDELIKKTHNFLRKNNISYHTEIFCDFYNFVIVCSPQEYNLIKVEGIKLILDKNQ
jgi:hypothetical protein